MRWSFSGRVSRNRRPLWMILEAYYGSVCILSFLAVGEKAFSAGGDIKEMQPKVFIDSSPQRFHRDWPADAGRQKCRKRPSPPSAL